jgi:hypothetical protein
MPETGRSRITKKSYGRLSIPRTTARRVIESGYFGPK